jgi:hypothetical protein
MIGFAVGYLYNTLLNVYTNNRRLKALPLFDKNIELFRQQPIRRY